MVYLFIYLFITFFLGCQTAADAEQHSDEYRPLSDTSHFISLLRNSSRQERKDALKWPSLHNPPNCTGAVTGEKKQCLYLPQMKKKLNLYSIIGTLLLLVLLPSARRGAQGDVTGMTAGSLRHSGQ